MNDDARWNLLARYLSGECSEEEEAKIQSWIEEDPARKTLLEEIRQVWQTTGSSSLEEGAPWNTNKLWDRVKEQTIRQEATGRSQDLAAGAPDRMPQRREHTRRRASRSSEARWFSVRKVATIGAVALVVAALAALWLRWPLEEGSQRASALETKTFTTQKGQRAVIRLTDGTRVHLNVDSRLTPPATFGAERRVVRLEGEAFFEVAEDSARPFVVRTGEAATRVLGTAFDVSAYPDGDGTQVIVKEGRVALGSDKEQKQPSAAQQKEDVVLTKGQMGRLLRSGEEVVRESVDTRRYLAWTQGQLVFEDASFEEVVRKLERWYDLTVALKDTTAAPPPGHLNARFTEGQSLDEVLSVVATAFGLEYEHRRKAVTFAPAEPRLPR